MDLTTKQGRREFFRSAGITGFGAAGALALLKVAETPAKGQAPQPGFHYDTPAQIFTAALIAEDLATTFYYNALVGDVIQDPALAAAGGTALNPGSAGDADNVSYVRAALGQEFAHAGLLRSLLNIAGPGASPVQTFYFPAGTFANLTTSDGKTPSFIGTLEAMENAFIGAYLTAVRAFAYMAGQTGAQRGNYYVLNGATLSSATRWHILRKWRLPSWALSASIARWAGTLPGWLRRTTCTTRAPTVWMASTTGPTPPSWL